MFPFCNLFGKHFFVVLKKSQNMMASIFIFLKVIIGNMTLKKIEADSNPHNFKILINKMNEKAGFEIILKRCEHVTCVTVRTISMTTTSMTTISMITKRCKSVRLGYSS